MTKKKSKRERFGIRHTKLRLNNQKKLYTYPTFPDIIGCPIEARGTSHIEILIHRSLSVRNNFCSKTSFRKEILLFVCRKNEFLRKTSSAKLNSQVIALKALCRANASQKMERNQ